MEQLNKIGLYFLLSSVIVFITGILIYICIVDFIISDETNDVLSAEKYKIKQFILIA